MKMVSWGSILLRAGPVVLRAVNASTSGGGSIGAGRSPSAQSIHERRLEYDEAA